VASELTAKDWQKLIDTIEEMLAVAKAKQAEIPKLRLVGRTQKV